MKKCKLTEQTRGNAKCHRMYLVVSFSFSFSFASSPTLQLSYSIGRRQHSLPSYFIHVQGAAPHLHLHLYIDMRVCMSASKGSRLECTIYLPSTLPLSSLLSSPLLSSLCSVDNCLRLVKKPVTSLFSGVHHVHHRFPIAPALQNFLSHIHFQFISFSHLGPKSRTKVNRLLVIVVCYS